MAEITVVARPGTEGKRLALVLTEDRVGHYPKFRDCFVRVFDLDRVGLTEPGFVKAPSGLTYALSGNRRGAAACHSRPRNRRSFGVGNRCNFHRRRISAIAVSGRPRPLFSFPEACANSVDIGSGIRCFARSEFST